MQHQPIKQDQDQDQKVIIIDNSSDEDDQPEYPEGPTVASAPDG
jgi:hypothetical protein